MRDDLLDALHARARRVRTRAAVRRWQYRQRNLAAGAWFRLRRVLADARAAYAISAEDGRRLLGEGCRPEVCGAQVVPEKTIVFVDEHRLLCIEGHRAIPVGLGPDFMAAEAIALVRFTAAPS